MGEGIKDSFSAMVLVVGGLSVSTKLEDEPTMRGFMVLFAIATALLWSLGSHQAGAYPNVQLGRPPHFHGFAASDAYGLVGIQRHEGSDHLGTRAQGSGRSSSAANPMSSSSDRDPMFICEPDGTGRIYCSNGGRSLTGFYCNACQSGPAIQPVVLPQVTAGTVLTELRRVGLPSLRAHTQPEVKTLVNFPTIFYTEPQPFSRTVTLLGQVVEIVATPESFTWHFGDSTTARTTTPGAPYPSMDITHEYTHARVTVRTSVDVTYSARFSVGGGAWQDIPGAVTIAGPTSPLRVVEATALLSGDYRS